MLSILLVDDDQEFTKVASHIMEFLGHTVDVAYDLKQAHEWLENNSFDHVLLDFMLPDGSGLHLMDRLKQLSVMPKVTFITGHPSVKSVVAELCGPKVDYLIKPIQREDLERVLSGAKPKQIASAIKMPPMHFGCLVGESAPMQQLYSMIERVAKTSANVMLMGESGVGKEVVAAAIHSASGLKGPLVATNCGGLSKELIGSELFGHEKGAFTGAIAQKTGVFEQAENGTLFLDEVTEMPIDMQPTLLRVLETKQVIRVGSTKETAVNCRIVSATNRSLQQIAEQNILREDIYFRLAVFPIEIPPLRQRTADISLLAKLFLLQFNTENNTSYVLTAAQIKRLEAYDWPGNVRELRHSIHRAVIMSDTKSSHLVLPEVFASPFSFNKDKQQGLTAGKTIEEVEKELIYLTLKKVDGNKTLAAEMLGISAKTLYNRLHAYGGLGEFS
ncbi:sigma-54-dependent Fis family transcriptional regulator [Escherichia coli]|nr:sigma-54-dependent Fis family transcriptional regulator [Escherichia coli]EES4259897.1 sigma-54-dependent Fis family transcriptional regulator [Escherichia coli]EES4260310.1 sigma-54-dependent Fis family transcriptional regulator [Escherichia coli]EET3908320.1 sigma-54-dependent Fis family transcriptional regulator [Escherichia coli]EET3908694.1 sigma-54-dependent Fis family transcriptional regulator [Escherichia coli]